MTRKALWGGLGLALLATVFVTTSDDDSDDAAKANPAPHLIDRLWISHMPDSDRDIVGKLAFVRSLSHGRYGFLENGSVWSKRIELFQWTWHNSQLVTRWPQDDKQVFFRVHTRDCEGEVPEPFELCLDIYEDDNKTTFVSRWDWVIRPRLDDEAQVDDPIVQGWIEQVVDSLPDRPNDEP